MKTAEQVTKNSSTSPTVLACKQRVSTKVKIDTTVVTWI